MLRMTQEVGMAHPEQTLREMLIEVAPQALRDAGRALVAAEKAMLDGTSDGLEYAERSATGAISAGTSLRPGGRRRRHAASRRRSPTSPHARSAS